MAQHNKLLGFAPRNGQLKARLGMIVGHKFNPQLHNLFEDALPWVASFAKANRDARGQASMRSGVDPCRSSSHTPKSKHFGGGGGLQLDGPTRLGGTHH